MADVHFSWPGDGVAQILVDAPPFNFTTPALFGEIEHALAQARDGGARVVVLGSAVEGYFLAHGSLENIAEIFGGRTASAEDAGATTRVLRELDRGPMVAIAAIDGQAWGGGAELSWSCDLRVASRPATFGQPEVMLGTTPGLGGATKIARLVGEATALRLVLDGRPISAEEAYRMGLVHQVVDPGCAVEAAVEWARWLAGRPPWALAACKELVKGARELSLRDALRRDLATFAEYCSRPEVLANIRNAQARYAEGSDSYDAFGLPRE